MASISSSLAGLPTANFPSLFSGIPQMEGPLGETEEKRLYFATNEDNSERTITTLQGMPLRGNIVLAVSGIFALNILAARIEAARAHGGEISGLVIVDRSPIVQTFWTDISKIIAGDPENRKPTRAEVIVKIGELISTKKDYFFDTSLLSPIQTHRLLTYHRTRFREEIQSGRSFASTDEQFKSVQKIFRNNHFKFLRLDLTDRASFEALGYVLRVNHLEVDTAYFSNVLQFTDSEAVTNFHASTEAIMSPNTIIVDTDPVCHCEIDSKGYTQRVRQRQSLPASELFITAVHDYGILSRAIALRDGIGSFLQFTTRAIAVTYSYFTGKSQTQVEART